MINTQVKKQSDHSNHTHPQNAFQPVEIQVLQEHYRVTEINSQMISSDFYINVATFQANQTSIKASWISNKDCSHYTNKIVSPMFSGAGFSPIGSLPADNVSLLTEPKPINLFETIPVEWVKNRDVVIKARMLFDQLPNDYKLLFNSIFWDEERFYRYCTYPSSLSGHHSETNGNLRHTVEVCENLLSLAKQNEHACQALLLFSGFIHDAGKADEYEKNKYGWQMSHIGKLHGHKVTALKWIIEAISKYYIHLPKEHYDGIIHIMTAQPNAPEWMGIRAPVLTESFLLSMADRYSGHVDLMNKTLPPNSGYGEYHKHLKAIYYKIGN